VDFDQQTFAILALAAEARNAAQFMEQEEDRVRLLELADQLEGRAGQLKPAPPPANENQDAGTT